MELRNFTATPSARWANSGPASRSTAPEQLDSAADADHASSAHPSVVRLTPRERDPPVHVDRGGLDWTPDAIWNDRRCRRQGLAAGPGQHGVLDRARRLPQRVPTAGPLR